MEPKREGDWIDRMECERESTIANATFRVTSMSALL